MEEWGYKIIGSPFTTQSRGTAILFKNSFEFEILKSTFDKRGNYTLCEISLHNGFSLILGSIYGPNKDNPAFIHTLSDLLEEFNNPNILLGGDWNCNRSFEIDNLKYVSENNKRMSNAIGDLCNNYSLVDAWRINNPTIRKFTWLQGVSNKQSRLYYFLCNGELLSITKNFSIKHKYRSDHAPIMCTLLLDNDSRGPGTWKMNNSLLKEKDFSVIITKEINNFKAVYAATPYNPNYIEAISHRFKIMISPTLFRETLLVTLRGAIIRYSKNRKKLKQNELDELERRIRTLDNTLSTGTASPADIIQLTELNLALVNIRKENFKGAYIRSRANWLEYGEKPSKFFLNLENKNKVNKNISEIELDNGRTITNQQEILSNLKKFYENLYQRQTPPYNHNIQEDPLLFPKTLTNQEKLDLETPITKTELDEALKNMNNNKSPGLDGYSAEFFKTFWRQLGDFFLDCINQCFQDNQLTNSQLQGLITCIPKTGKARNLI